MVTLTTWHHVIEELDPKSLTAELTNLEGVDMILTDPMRVRAGLAQREYLMYVIRVDGEVLVARTSVPKRDMHEQNRLQKALVDTYKDRGRLHRVMSEELEEVKAAEAEGIVGPRGHRSVGGLRALLYNAVPLESIHALAQFMAEFQRKNV